MSLKSLILLVEDEEKTGQMLKMALETEGIDVEWVKAGQEALTLLEKGKYDLIVLDLKLPGMSGDDVLEEIRRVDPYVEVIVYTNYENPPVMMKLINLGVEGYIKKGSDADLWQTVKQIKSRLDPFSDEERAGLLESIPKGIFETDKDEKDC